MAKQKYKGKYPPKTKKINKNNKQKSNKKQIDEKEKVFSSISDDPFKQGEMSKPAFVISLIAIIILTAIVYFPSMKNEVTNWDDDKYILKNSQTDLSVNGLKNMFFTNPFFMGNYHPLTMLSLAIDHNISHKTPPTDKKPFGTVDPFWFHLHNILLHLISTALLFLIAYKIFTFLKFRYRLEATIILAALFGVHTIHVESVVWMSERKDVLYMMYYSLSLYLYIEYIAKKKIGFLIGAFAAFILSALAKGQAVSFAVTLIAVDYLYKRNFKDFKVIAEKVVFILVGIGFGVIAIYAQQHGQAIHTIDEYTYLERLMIASYGLTQYLWKMIIPVNLSAIYPYPYGKGGFPWYYYLTFITAIALIFALIVTFKKHRKYAFSILFFGLNIALLLQIIPVGSAIIADRYAYVPSIGYCFVMAILFEDVVRKNKQFRNILLSVFAAYVMVLSVLTFNRVQVWKDSITLWDDVINKYPSTVIAYNNRGSAKKEKELNEAAIADFSKAIEMKQDYKHAIFNRGTARKDIDDFKGALSDFNTAILLDADFSQAYLNRGITKDNLGDQKGAIEDYNIAITLDGSDMKAYVNLGVAYGKSGIYDKAIEAFNHVISVEPDNADAYSNRGLAKNFIGIEAQNLNNTEKATQIFKDALKDYETAISLRPDFSDAYYNRAMTKEKLGDLKGAINDHSMVLQINAQFASSYYYRGLLYLKSGENTKACNDLRIAKRYNYQVDQYLEKYCQ